MEHLSVLIAQGDFIQFRQFADTIGDVNILDRNNMTPLHLAASYDNYDMVAYLLTRGANADIVGWNEYKAIDMCDDAATWTLLESVTTPL